MKIACPHCGQKLELNGDWAGRTLDCPACARPVALPRATAAAPAAPRPAARALPTARAARPAGIPAATTVGKTGRTGGFGRAAFWLTAVLLTGGLVYGYQHVERSPRPLRERVDALESGTRPADPAPSLAAMAVPPPEPTAAPVAEITPLAADPAPLAAATPRPDAMTWLLAHRERWPREVALTKMGMFPVVYNGQAAGEGKVDAGNAVGLVAIEPPSVTVAYAAYGGAPKRVPIAATDLLARAQSMMAQSPGEEGAGTAPTPAPPVPPVSATPTATPTLMPTPPAGEGNALDTLVFGNLASETQHALAATNSAVCQNELTLFGPGNLWDQEDVLVFHHQRLTGDGWIQARVISAGETSGWTKVGVMVRESLDANAKNAFMLDSNDHGLHAQWRTDTGGGTGQSDSPALTGTAPFWVRVERKGDTFTMSASADGKTWAEAKSQTIKMGVSTYLGLVNTAGSPEKINYAIFDAFSSSAPATTPWTDTTIGKTPLRGGSMVNGLGEPARRMLPREPAYYYGGDLTFRVAVDPKQQNYVTAKLWGSDGSGKMGRVILTCEGKEIGMRHGGGLDIFIHNVGAVSPGAFWYRTSPLPKWLTEGKTSVEIKLRSVGDLFAYGQPWNYDTYQHKLVNPTRGIYRFYTHTDPMLAPSPREVQGQAPDYATAPKRPAEDDTAFFKKLKEDKNRQLAELLKKGDPSQNDAITLADGYGVAWTVAYRKPETVAQILRAVDAVCRKYNADNKFAGAEWGGNFGPAGYALAAIAPAAVAPLDERVDLGSGPKPRREQYAAMLRASVDVGRFNRQSITNQALINAFNVYRANRGLLAIKAKEALPEDQARRYYREACGMEEWRGSDLPAGGSKYDAGRGVLMMTAKGTSREWNWCCANCYGRMDPYVYEMYRLTGDVAFRDRAIQIQRAHNYMVYPSVDEGGYRTMLNEGVICTRNVYQPGHTFYGYTNIVSSLTDAALLGGWKQGITDNQLLDSWQLGEASLFFPDDYARTKAALATNPNLPPLPTTPGQPDFAWADEQNALLSIKHGREQHFITFARRSEGGIHRIGDVHSLTPQSERVVQFVVDDIRFTNTGETRTVGPEVESDFTGKPPDNPVSAYAGQKLPRPPGRAGSPADFYGVRYGDFVIGMNCSADKRFEFKPEGVIGGTDLVSGKRLVLPMQVPPQTTVVFFAPVKAAAQSFTKR